MPKKRLVRLNTPLFNFSSSRDSGISTDGLKPELASLFHQIEDSVQETSSKSGGKALIKVQRMLELTAEK